MKLKYYMRGMGIGVFVTTIIFLIAIAFMKPNTANNGTATAEATDKQTIKEEQQKEAEEAATDEATEDNDEAVAEEEQADTKESTVETTVSDDGKTVTTVEKIPGPTEDAVETVPFTIVGGEGSNTVGNKLQQAGLVDNGSRFNRYLEDNNYDNVIQPGTYSIPKGSTYEEVAQIITTRQ
jgi:mannitol-specific phosphotransferase system IIBC component